MNSELTAASTGGRSSPCGAAQCQETRRSTSFLLVHERGQASFSTRVFEEHFGQIVPASVEVRELLVLTPHGALQMRHERDVISTNRRMHPPCRKTTGNGSHMGFDGDHKASEHCARTHKRGSCLPCGVQCARKLRARGCRVIRASTETRSRSGQRSLTPSTPFKKSNLRTPFCAATLIADAIRIWPS